MNILDFSIDKTHFRLWNCQKSDVKLAKEEARKIVDDASKIKGPYPPKREYIFKDLAELLEHRKPKK